MKLDRLATIKRIDDLLAASRMEFEAAQRKAADAQMEELAVWRQQSAPALLAELRRVVEQVRKGTYPGETPLRRNGYASDSIWGRVGSPRETAEYHPSVKLTRLRAILADATTDDFVTTASLRELGFNPSLFIS